MFAEMGNMIKRDSRSALEWVVGELRVIGFEGRKLLVVTRLTLLVGEGREVVHGTMMFDMASRTGQGFAGVMGE